MSASLQCFEGDTLAPYARAVSRELSRYTYPERWLRYATHCYPESFRYTMAHRQIPGILVTT
jgi:hypothetical protein